MILHAFHATECKAPSPCSNSTLRVLTSSPKKVAMSSRADFLATGLEPIVKPADDLNCAICQEHSKTDLIRLPCHHTHIFCKPCISDWLQRPGVRTCPQCRKKLFELPAGEVIPVDEEELDPENGDEVESLSCVEERFDPANEDELRSLTSVEDDEEQVNDESDSDSDIDALVDDEEVNDLDDESSDDDIEDDVEDDDSSGEYQSDSDDSDSSGDEDMDE